MKFEPSKNEKKYYIFFISALTLYALWLIWPLLKNVPEFTTSHVLLTVKEWWNTGFIESKFIGRMPAYENALTEGRLYISYPIATFLIPYLYSVLTFHLISLTEIELLGFVFHVVTALLISGYFRKYISIKSSYVVFFLYLLMPGALFSHSQLFYGDILVNFFIVLVSMYTYNLWKEKIIRPHQYGLLALITALGTLIEFLFWFYLLFIAIFAIAHLFKKTTNKKRTIAILATLFSASAVALVINISLYIYGVDGLNNFLNILKERFSDRGGTANILLLINQFKWFMEIALSRIGAYVFILSIPVALFFARNDAAKKHILIPLLLASLTHILLFQDLFINHPFTIMKFLLLGVIAIGVIFARYEKIPHIISISITIAIIVSGIWSKTLAVNYGKDNELAKGSKIIGTIVNAHTPKEHIACISPEVAKSILPNDHNYLLLPMYYFYANRNSILCNESRLSNLNSQTTYFLTGEEYQRHVDQLNLVTTIEDIHIGRLINTLNQ